MKQSSSTQKVIRVVAAVIEQKGKYLVTQRRTEAVLPSLWEFPGGKVEPGEADADALVRELQHRLAVEVRVQELLSFVKHPYERYSVELFLYRCEVAHGEAVNHAVQAHRWVSSDEFEQLDFTPADEVSMTQLLELDD